MWDSSALPGSIKQDHPSVLPVGGGPRDINHTSQQNSGEMPLFLACKDALSNQEAGRGKRGLLIPVCFKLAHKRCLAWKINSVIIV